jgi:hypothetical protein
MKDACHKIKKKFGRKKKLREYSKKKTELLSQRLQFKINSLIADGITNNSEIPNK